MVEWGDPKDFDSKTTSLLTSGLRISGFFSDGLFDNWSLLGLFDSWSL